MSPSKLRIPLTVLFGLVAVPLGLIAWIALSGSQRRDYLRSNWVRAGFSVGVVSALPLLAVVAAAALGLWPDPDPNPIGLGLLLLAGGIIGTFLVIIGIVLVGNRGR